MNHSYTILKGRRGVAIERTVAELKTILRDIILEVGELKERVTLLELAAQKRTDEDTIAQPMAGEPIYNTELNQAEANPGELPSVSSGNPGLQQIYMGGRHVCPMAFGEERSEGCLFCAAMLARGKL